MKSKILDKQHFIKFGKGKRKGYYLNVKGKKIKTLKLRERTTHEKSFFHPL